VCFLQYANFAVAEQSHPAIAATDSTSAAKQLPSTQTSTANQRANSAKSLKNKAALNSVISSDSPAPAVVKPGRRFSFQQLDREAEQLLKEVLDLSSDLAIVEEQQNNPAKFQLLVLVTMAPTDLFKLDYIELKIDEQTVAAHNYTSSEFDALQLGGGQRLYVANLPAGLHKLYASMAGRVPRDPDYKSAVNFSFISGVSRTVLELSVSGAQTRGFPILQVVEHN
jgi:hypothetical protein